MRVLAVNCGSSSLKFQVIEVVPDRAAGGLPQRLAWGRIEQIGEHPTAEFGHGSAGPAQLTVVAADHAQAMVAVLDWLSGIGLVGTHGIGAVGHRVVHGGRRFAGPTLLDDATLAAIEELSELAPVHNPPALSAIRAARDVLGSQVPAVVTFDTTFHRTLPERAALYAVPRDWETRHGVRRYGFHGLAHRCMADRAAALLQTPIEETRLITLQLGNGCSASAIAGGRSVDTSMGFTPLEGLVMGTRSGDIDPSVIPFLAGREHVEASAVEGWLNHRAGLFGVSGCSADMRDLLAAERSGDEGAALAVELFCYRVRKYLGAYLAVLGGADAVVFGGGIGEHAASIRARICADMGWFGLVLDGTRNLAANGVEARISLPGARVGVYVVPVDEEFIIVRDTMQCLHLDTPTA